MSYLKLVLRRQNQSELNPSINIICKKLVNYIHQHCHDRPIPSIPRFKQEFEKDYGIHQLLFTESPASYLEVLQRTYILMYMLHYSMPIQRKYIPGKRSITKSTNNYKKNGWLSYLNRKEQHIVLDPSLCIMSQDIPENNVDGASQNMLTNFTEVNKVDVLNTQIFWDGSMTTAVGPVEIP